MPIFLSAPEANEHAPYMSNYIRHVKPGSIEVVLKADQDQVARLFASIGAEKAEYAYAPGKWTVKQTIIHCMDTERIFACRALMLARGDQGKLPGYDHEAYAAKTLHDMRSLSELQAEWEMLRQLNLTLFQSFNAADMTNIGNANANPLSPRAIAFIISGHTLHHMEVLREKYGLEF